MRAEIDAVFDAYPPERVRDDKDEFRYEMLNRSAACQARDRRTRGSSRSIEPLLGDDCHVIANTAWRNPPEFTGGFWHCDAGPHVPAARGRAVGRSHPVPGVRGRRAHPACRTARCADGPTAVVPGQPPIGPARAVRSHERRGPHVRRPAAGDVSRSTRATCRCSSPTRGTAGCRHDGGRGRYFLQVHYGRRDIAQRMRTTDERQPVSPEAIAARRHRPGARRSSACTTRSSTTAEGSLLRRLRAHFGAG